MTTTNGQEPQAPSSDGGTNVVAPARQGVYRRPQRATPPAEARAATSVEQASPGTSVPAPGLAPISPDAEATPTFAPPSPTTGSGDSANNSPRTIPLIAEAPPTAMALDDFEPSRVAGPSRRRALVAVAGVVVLCLAVLVAGVVTRRGSDGENLGIAAGPPAIAADETLAPTSTATATTAASPVPASVSRTTEPATRASETPEPPTTAAPVTTAAPTPPTAASVAPETSAAPATSAAAPANVPATAATLPDGSPVPVLAIFNGDRVVLEGAVPNQAALDLAHTLAVANAKGTATITNRLTIDPAVPANVPVRVIELQSVRFPSGSIEILPDHALELDRVGNVMLAFPHVTALVVGHADQVGSDDANLQISLDRADAVVSYLIGRGVTVDRLSARGVGETDLLAEDLGDDALALNRRTEFIFYGLLIPPA